MMLLTLGVLVASPATPTAARVLVAAPSTPTLAAGETPIGAGIRQFCGTDSVCVERQRESAKHFLGLTVMFDAPKAEQARCLSAGKIRAGVVDWTLSEACLRTWSKGRKPFPARN